MDLSRLRVKELNELCKEYGVRTGGKKADIVSRIQASASYQRALLMPGAPVTNGKVAGHGSHATGFKRSSADGGSSPVSSATKKLKGLRADDCGSVHTLFDRFKDAESEEDAITDDGILELCGELGVDAQDPVMLVLSYVMEAETMCVYSRAEFVRGFQKLHCRTLQDLKDQLPLLRRKLQNREQFTSIYSYTFSFSKDPTQKCLALEIALGLWELLLPGHFTWLYHWLEFVRTNCRNSVSKDLWMQVLEFGQQIEPDMSNFDENGAWPVLLDDFATELQEKIAEHGISKVRADESALQPKDDSDAVESMVVDDL